MCLPLAVKKGRRRRRGIFSLISKPRLFARSHSRLTQPHIDFNCSKLIPYNYWGISSIIQGSECVFNINVCALMLWHPGCQAHLFAQNWSSIFCDMGKNLVLPDFEPSLVSKGPIFGLKLLAKFSKTHL